MEERKRLWNENTVVYKLYPADTGDSLTQLAITYCNILSDLTSQYIWHYEKFHLTARNEPVPHLIGSTCYRDNVEDEWHIVKLLLNLTTETSGLVVNIFDDDGEFILIEAAHYLPKWIKPETVINRVFIYQGDLHIIPQPSNPAQLTVFPVATPTITQALSLIRDPNVITVATPTVQKCIKSKINSCSFAVHNTHCYLPLPAAHILSFNNQLVSSVVHAFLERDKTDMRVANKLVHFSPKDYPMVLIDLRFSRMLYAMLINDRLAPPTKYWPTSTQNPLAVTLGIKLTCGLEILASSYGQSSVGGDKDHQFSQFLSQLKSKGYFGDEIEGSLHYQKLIKSAKEYYKNESMAQTSVLHSAGKLVNECLLNKDWSMDYFSQKVLQPPDDDSWLNITPDDLDMLLQKRQDSNSLGLEEAAFGVKSFVNQVSSVDGAEFPWSANDTSEIELNPETFVDTCMNMLKKLETIDIDSSDSNSLLDDDDVSDTEMNEIMEQMDNELSQTTIGQTFHKTSNHDDSEVGVAQPLDIDFNLVHNLLDSYNEQMGGAATPTSNILNTLGISLSAKK